MVFQRRRRNCPNVGSPPDFSVCYGGGWRNGGGDPLLQMPKSTQSFRNKKSNSILIKLLVLLLAFNCFRYESLRRRVVVLLLMLIGGYCYSYSCISFVLNVMIAESGGVRDTISLSQTKETRTTFC